MVFASMCMLCIGLQTSLSYNILFSFCLLFNVMLTHKISCKRFSPFFYSLEGFTVFLLKHVEIFTIQPGRSNISKWKSLWATTLHK